MSTERATPTTSCDRRDFIKGAAYVVLAVQCLPVSAFASDVSLQETTPGDLFIKSGPGALRHMHYLRVPSSLLATPPAHGATLLTTKALLHQHRVVLTHDELRGIHRGDTVRQRASSHVFVIALANGTAPPTR